MPTRVRCAMPLYVVLICGAVLQAGADDVGELKLMVKSTWKDGKLVEAEASALAEVAPAALSPEQAQAAQRALEQVLKLSASDDEAVRIAALAAPDRALQYFLTQYDRMDKESRKLVGALAVRGGPRWLPLLIRALMDEGARVGPLLALDTRGAPTPTAELMAACVTATPKQILAALDVVGEKGDTAAIPGLRTLAAHTDAKVREKALQRLVLIADPSVAADLRRGLGDPVMEVRGAALRGLATLGELKDTDLAAALVGAGEALTDTVLELMPATENPELRTLMVQTGGAAPMGERRWVLAAKAAARQGYPEHLSWLLGLLQSEDKKTRAGAAEALGSHPALTDYAPLIRLAREDKESEVSSAAGHALARAGGRAVTEAIEALGPKDPGWRGFVSGLCDQGVAEADHVLAAAQEAPADADWWAFARYCKRLEGPPRYALAAVVLERGGGETQRFIIEMLSEEKSAEARRTLVAGCDAPGVLCYRCVKSEHPLFSRLQTVRGVPVIFVQPGESAESLLMAESQDTYADMWRLVLEALPAEGADRQAATERLKATARKGLTDPEPPVREGAMKVLAALSPDEDQEALLGAIGPAVTDPEVVVRRGAAQACTQLAGETWFPFVERLLQDTDCSVVVAACGAAGSHPKHAAAFVSAAKDLGGHEWQQEAVDGLAAMPGPDVLAALAQLAVEAKDDDLAVKAMAAALVAAAGEADTSHLERALKPVVAGANSLRALVAVCILAAADAPAGLEALWQLPTDIPAPYQLAMGGDYKGGRDEALVSPARARVLAVLGFRRGYETEGFIQRRTTTYLFLVPVARSRRLSSFGVGDRWPLDLQVSCSTDVNPAVIIAADYDDPRADQLIQVAARHTDEKQRRSAVYAMALRDDRVGVERMLADPSAGVVEAAVKALRLLGHRASVAALVPFVEKYPDAAKAIVELTLVRDQDERQP